MGVLPYSRVLSVVNNQIIPWFGNARLQDITHFLVHEMYEDKINEGLSSAYVRNIHTTLCMLLKVAKKWELIQKDVASMIEPPRLKKKEMKVWDIEQINAFLKHTKHSRYHLAFVLACYTGMRKGEILALTWDDIDFDEKIINVNKTLYKAGERITVNEPKTPFSVRRIYFDSDIESALKRHKVKQNLESLKTGITDRSYLFLQEDGSLVEPTAINVMFTRYLNQLNLPRIRFHDLRHSHATILLEMGVNPKLVADRLGHSSVKITLDVYSHIKPSMQKDLTEQFSAAMKTRNVTKM